MSGSDTLKLIEENLPEGLRDELEESEMGTQVGGSYGEQAGRELGQQVGSTLEDRFRARLNEGANLIGALRAALVALPGAILSALRDASSPGGVVENLKNRLKREATSLLPDSVADEEPADEAEETAEAAANEAESIPGLPDSVDQLREETIRDLLEVMSYRDIQSTAKELDIPANQSHEDIMDDIVKHFTDDAAEEADEADA